MKKNDKTILVLGAIGAAVFFLANSKKNTAETIAPGEPEPATASRPDPYAETLNPADVPPPTETAIIPGQVWPPKPIDTKYVLNVAPYEDTLVYHGGYTPGGYGLPVKEPYQP